MSTKTLPTVAEKYVSSPYIYFVDMSEREVQINNFLTRINQGYPITYGKVLSRCKSPIILDELFQEFSADIVHTAIAHQLLIQENVQWHPNAFIKAEIETTTYCNFRCKYCPVHDSPKTPKVMPVTDFRRIIHQIKKSSSIHAISFSAYNEPLIDPFIFDRLSIVADNGLRLILHTNGAGLTKKVADHLHDCGNVDEIYINFPDYDRRKYSQYTGSDAFDLVCKNVDYAIGLGLGIDFSVQKIDAEYIENLRRMNEVYSHRIGKKIVAWNTVDRAGLLQNEYCQGICIHGNLAGCKNILDWLSIDVEGNCYICSNDFYTNYTYGNILVSDLNSIVNGAQYEKILRQVFGDTVAAADFICRRCYEMRLMSVYKRIEMQVRKRFSG